MNGKGLTVVFAAALLALGAAGCAVEAGDSESVSDADRVRQIDVSLQAAGDDGDPADEGDDAADGDDGLGDDVWIDEGSDFGPGTGDNPIPEPWHLRNGQEDNGGDPDTKAAAQGTGQTHDK